MIKPVIITMMPAARTAQFASANARFSLVHTDMNWSAEDGAEHRRAFSSKASRVSATMHSVASKNVSAWNEDFIGSFLAISRYWFVRRQDSAVPRDGHASISRFASSG